MGRGDRRKSPKKRRLVSQRKFKLRRKNKREAGKASKADSDNK